MASGEAVVRSRCAGGPEASEQYAGFWLGVACPLPTPFLDGSQLCAGSSHLVVGTGQMRPAQPGAVHGGQLVSSLQPPRGLFASVSPQTQASGWRFADAGLVCTERDVGQLIKGGGEDGPQFTCAQKHCDQPNLKRVLFYKKICSSLWPATGYAGNLTVGPHVWSLSEGSCDVT